MGGTWDSRVGELNPSETDCPESMAEIGFSLCKSMVGSRWKILVALRPNEWEEERLCEKVVEGRGEPSTHFGGQLWGSEVVQPGRSPGLELIP